MRFLLPLLFLSTSALFAQPAPEWFTYPGSPVAGRFEDIFFVNDTTGWAACSDGQVYRTLDGGKDWDLQLNEWDYFRSIEFFDDQVGFAGSLYGKLFKTMNGGEDWYEITDSLPEEFPGICGMSVADDTTIYACGIWSSPGYIFKSTDRGHTWEYIDMSMWADGLVDLKFTDAHHGFATGKSSHAPNQGVVLYTDDGGDTWTEKLEGGLPNEFVWKIQLIDAVHAVGSLEDLSGTHDSRMIVSNDGGMNWEIKTVSEDYYNVEMCGFINPDTGWVGGWFDGSFETFDGGDTWHENDFGNNLNRFFKLNDNLAYASGSTIYIYSDTAYVAPVDTTTDTTIIDTTTTAIIDFTETANRILDISPNPSTDFITIQYQIDRYTTIDLSIYDMQGYIRKTIYHGNIRKGTYTESWKHDLPPGEYVVSMHCNEGLRWKRFVVQ